MIETDNKEIPDDKNEVMAEISETRETAAVIISSEEEKVNPEEVPLKTQEEYFPEEIVQEQGERIPEVNEPLDTLDNLE